MIDVLWSQIGRPDAPRGHAWHWGGVAFLLVSLLPGTAIGQEDGADASLVTGTIKDPAFSPSHSDLVAYSRQVEDTQGLYLYDTAEETVRRITAVEEVDEQGTAGNFFETDNDRPLRRFEGQLAWRPLRDPDGRQWFAFVSSASETGYGLFVSYLTPEGNVADRTIELPFDGQATAPTWSPDGRQLAFSGSRAGVEGNELFLYPNLRRFLRPGEEEVPADASPVPLTETPASNLSPDWSPDGQYIAYQSKRTEEDGPSNWGISLLDLSTWAGPQGDAPPRSVRLTGQLSAYHEYRPSWSPGGRYVGYYVSQSEVDASTGNRRLDIGVLELVQGSEGRSVQAGQIQEGYTGNRLAQNVLPNENRGPEWHPSESPPSLIYVKKEENEDNPIYLADVSRWSSKNAEFSRRLSGQFEEETRLHEEVDATHGAEGLRLAFVSQEGKSLRLQVRGPLRPTYGLAQAENDRAENDRAENDRAENDRAENDRAESAQAESAQRCRIQFAAKGENDSQMKDYKEKVNKSLKGINTKVIRIDEGEHKYKLVSGTSKERKKEIKKVIDKRIERSEIFQKIKEWDPFPKCYQ